MTAAGIVLWIVITIPLGGAVPGVEERAHPLTQFTTMEACVAETRWPDGSYLIKKAHPQGWIVLSLVCLRAGVRP